MLVGWLPPFHDMGLIGNLLQPLFVGFPATLFSPGAFLRDPAQWLRTITACRATVSGAPNFAYDHCVKSIAEEQKQGLDLRSWAVAYNGAEPVRADTLARFSAAFAGQGFRPEAFFPCYGLAESTLFVSGGPPGRPRVARSPVSSGRLAEGTRVVIVDLATRIACPPGSVGEVWTASASVAQGYWGRPQETSDTFEARLADTGEGPFLRTGDLGFLLDGELSITGRLKDMIDIRGRNLYPHDVEAAVERVLPFLEANACAAFGIEAGGEERLAVVIEADRHLVRRTREAEQRRTAGDAESDALIARVRQAVDDEFEVAVHAVAFVRPGGFPRTSSGKVQRQACREAMLAGKLDLLFGWQAVGAEDSAPSGHVEPSAARPPDTIRERIHAEILRWVRSKVDANAQRIEYDATFGSLGIDSVGAVALALDIEKATGRRVELDALYAHPTIEQLARHLENSSADPEA